MSLSRNIVIICLLLTLSSCGFRPLYGPARSSDFAAIEIMPIKDRIGQQLYNDLLVRLNPHGQSPQPRYALTVEISESKSELAVRKTAFATRANLEVTAGFTLFDYQSGKNVTSGTSSISVSFNILASEYGTSVAIKDARTNAVRELAEDIRIRLGVYLDGLQGQG